MNEYLFYYNEDDHDSDGNMQGTFIWYSRINEDSIAAALKIFVESVSSEDRIIQIIVKNKLQ